MHTCTQAYEDHARQQGYQFVAGLDEAGRGSLFGPVVAAAVVLDLSHPVIGLNDSKQLTAKSRERFYDLIMGNAFGWAIAEMDAARVDAWNILEATKQAMELAVASIPTAPDFLLIDAVRLPVPIPQLSIIHGDALSVSIAAASILAKVHRDRLMAEWDKVYPQYGLGEHKGYPTAKHLAALQRYGPTPHHRWSFAPVRRVPAPSQFEMFQ